MNKALPIVQTIIRILKIVCRVGYVCCLVGGIGCLVAATALFCVPGITHNASWFRHVLETETTVSWQALALATVQGAIACTASGFLCHKGARYCENELAVGTPFTIDGAKELFRLGVYATAVPVGMTIAQGIAAGLFAALVPDLLPLDVEYTIHIGTGLSLMFLSLVLQCGIPQKEES